MAAQLTYSAIDAIAVAIFSKPGAKVLEAYSDIDQLPREFESTEDLAKYAKKRARNPKGLAFFFVIYPDMAGRAIRETIRLKSECDSGKLRYTWQGWGLIGVQFSGDPSVLPRIAANSEKRALAWSSTYPDWAPPGSWNWKSVERHTRRLQRALRTMT